MNLTIPIRAQSSTSSWSRQLRGGSSMKNIKADRKRYIFSMITAMLLIGTLVVGSVGGMLQVASARDNFSPANYNNYSDTSQNPGSSTPATPAKVTPAPQPAATTPPTSSTPVTAATPVPETTPAPVAAQSAPSVAKTITPQPATEAPTVAPVDTEPAIANMAAAQADKSTQVVSYTSGRLSDDTRNRILILAAVATVTGALLYTISFIGAAAPASRREIPIRYIVPVKEVITS